MRAHAPCRLRLSPEFSYPSSVPPFMVGVLMPEIAANHNQFAYSVSEISGALKRVVEDNFGSVRVRGEISGWKVAASGHAYLKLKDENAVLDGVCWKGVVGKLPFKPEDGIDVICSGQIGR